MKKKLLFVIPALQLGGAEKSFVNLLNVMDYEQYEVDVFMFTKVGFFLDLIPENVTILEESEFFQNFSKPFFRSILNFWQKPILLVNKILFTLSNNLTKDPVIAEQKNWKYLQHFFPVIPKQYDVAIGYLEKSANYFTIEKTNASKKIGWIHTDLESLGIDFNLETPFLRKFDYVVTVSDGLSTRLSSKLPDINNNIKTIENINSKNVILKLAVEIPAIKFDNNYINIIFVGRLAKEKGLSTALAAIAELISRGHQVRFYLIGSGNQEKDLRTIAQDKGIASSIIFLGNQSNPYQYMNQANLFLLTSFYEGKSIALEEAKLMQLPIVTTNFSSAKDQITSGENGLIAAMNELSIADAVEEVLNNKLLQQKFKNSLSNLTGNEGEIEKLYKLLNE